MINIRGFFLPNRRLFRKTLGRESGAKVSPVFFKQDLTIKDE
jgi:hypothetical protein